jgi:hypothetical protein
LFADQVAAKMTAENDTYDRYRTGQVFGPSAVNSSDSEAEAYPATSPKASDQLPKRNKRKNFKPRCSNVAAYSEAEALSDFAANDNINNNVRRRKTLATRRLVVDARHSPMDLSKNNDSDSNSDTDDYNDDDAAKIPSSFSIHTLSKPHVAEAGGAHPQVSDMREYAMNTMRELLGIYGLTSEVAESISRQLPIAAFSSGKCISRPFNAGRVALKGVKSLESPGGRFIGAINRNGGRKSTPLFCFPDLYHCQRFFLFLHPDKYSMRGSKTQTATISLNTQNEAQNIQKGVDISRLSNLQRFKKESLFLQKLIILTISIIKITK